jgi:DNA-binding GntR family transcriptional regulator
MASAVAISDTETIAATEFAFHRAFNHATGRIKLAWFLLHVARSMPLKVYAADPGWGAAAVDNHRKVIAALRRRDTAAVVEHTDWQFTDGARRLIETLDHSGIWG